MTMVKGFEDVSENELMDMGGEGPENYLAAAAIFVMATVIVAASGIQKAWNESNGLPSSSSSGS